MMSAANCLGKEIRYIEDNQLLGESQLLLTHCGTVGDNNGVDTFTGLHVFEATLSEET